MDEITNKIENELEKLENFNNPDFNEVEEIQPGIVETDDRADYYLELLIGKQAEINRLTDRIEALNHRIGKIKNGMSYYKMMLEQYMEGLNKSNPKHKTHPLAFGELAARKLPDRVEIAADLTEADYDQYTPFVNMKVTYQADKKALKEAAKQEQELPSWASVVEGKTKYTVKIRDDEGRETVIE